MADRVDQQLGNYHLIRLLGKGGFAEVYLGEHVYLKNQAAIKVLHTQLAKDDLENFLSEARTLVQLIHPHIVRVLDFGVENDTPFLVMDYAPNGTLRQRHPKGAVVPLATIVDYVKQVADALQYAHEQKLIHRDIKPENLLLGRRNEILLSDFGIATVAQSTRQESTQHMAGTIGYIAPEQIQAHPRPASDQYALGVVVYEWLSGDRPFHGSLSETAAKHMLVPPPSLREKISTLPPEVEQVVLTALEKDPHQRFASVRAFAIALELASQSSPSSKVIMPLNSSLSQPGVTLTPSSLTPQLIDVVVAIPPNQPSLSGGMNTLAEHTLLARVRNTLSHDSAVSPLLMGEHILPGESKAPKRAVSRRTLLAGLVGVAAAGTGITWWLLSSREHPSSGRPSTPPYHLGDIVYIYHGHSNLVLDVVWAPDGKRIASGSADTTAQVWDATTGNHTLTYDGHSDEVRVVPWSPDGKHIASGSDDTTVQVWDAATGNRLFTYRGHSKRVSDVTWSPDGKYIASGSGDSTVQVWDAGTGRHIYTYHGHSSVVDSVAWSPDGKYIASGSGDKTVQVWDAATGRHIYTYHGHSKGGRDVAWSPDSKCIASGSTDTTVQVWDAVTGIRLFTYHGESGFVYAVSWAPNGKYIAFADFDKTVQVWDAGTGRHIYTYHGHSSVVEAVAWSPDGKYIASGSGDNTVQVWMAL